MYVEEWLRGYFTVAKPNFTYLLHLMPVQPAAKWSTHRTGCPWSSCFHTTCQISPNHLQTAIPASKASDYFIVSCCKDNYRCSWLGWGGWGLVEVNKIILGQGQTSRAGSFLSKLPQTCPPLTSFVSPGNLSPSHWRCCGLHSWSMLGAGCYFSACARDYRRKVIVLILSSTPILRLMNVVSL